MEKKIDVSDIDLRMIEDITSVFEICNEYRQMFCFTVTLRNQEIINVFRHYKRSNRRQKLEEIKKEHEKLLTIYQYYQKKYKDQ
jgi:hypothetical protein